MKTSILIVISLVLLFNKVKSQDTSYNKRPFQITFIYPVGLHGINSSSNEYSFSFNVLTGITGRIDGAEIAGLVNINKSDVSGFQLSGIGNMTAGNVSGAQIGGIYNICGNQDGFQLSGIFSKSKKSDGLQLSGILNISESSEASIAGIANINSGEQNGIQIGGIYNQAKVLNGIQIGLINKVDSIEKGFSIGLINLIRNGRYDEWTVSTADYLNLAISYKTGLKKFYTIFTLGMNLMKDQLWVGGIGLGHLSDINSRFSFQPEIMFYNYLPMSFTNLRESHATHFKFGFVRNVNSNLALSFSPSLYVAFKSNENKYSYYGYEQSPINEIFDVKTRDHSKIDFGVGFSFAVHII